MVLLMFFLLFWSIYCYWLIRLLSLVGLVCDVDVMSNFIRIDDMIVKLEGEIKKVSVRVSWCWDGF